MTKTIEYDDQLCPECGHDFGDHILVKGGATCPVEECDCFVAISYDR